MQVTRAMVLCCKCGNPTPAQLGVFVPLCDICLKIKRCDQAKTHPTLFEEPGVEAGDKIIVLWGKFGQVNARVSYVSKSGKIYVQRWNKKRQQWTRPRRVEPHKGIHRIY